MSQLTGGAERYLIVEMEAEKGSAAKAEDVARVEVDYFDLAAAKRSAAADMAVAKRSADAKAIEASANDEIIAKVAEQQANLVTEEAVMLRDKGDIAGAKALLKKNAAELYSIGSQYSLSAETAARLDGIRAQNEKAAKSLTEKDWAKTRKSMRYEQHKTKRQQTY
jgi:Ca-activated chloride channel family protein